MLDQSQQRAVDGISKLDSRLYLLTGPGGSGKTFTLRHLLQRLWNDEQSGITSETTYMAAPTGKAAKVIMESLPDNFLAHQPSTIHRMLMYNPASGWGYNAENKLDASLIILDESSMIDSLLLSRVIDAMPPECVLILVGDVEQVPPVGPGQPFADLIRHGLQDIVFRLTTNHRQAQGSLIAHNCSLVLAGEKFLFGKQGKHSLGGELTDDMFFIDVDDDKESVVGHVIEVAAEWHRDGLDYAVLAPQHKGVCGVENLNKAMQASFNPARDGVNELSMGFLTIREGDRVLQTKNCYELEVFNGFLGVVTAIDPVNKLVTIDFDGQTVLYDKPGYIKQLQLGYAMSVHKAQGSQFKYGAVVCHSTHYFMWSRNLLYTSVSRYREELHMIGNHKALNRGRKNIESSARNTYLQLKFKQSQ